MRDQHLALFAYGSLVSRASAAATLGRDPDELRPTRLPGWRRRFSTARDNRRSEKTFALADGSIPAWILALNLEPVADLEPVGADSSDPPAAPAEPGMSSGAHAPAPNGALLAVTGAELERLDARELRYERVDVTAALGDEAEARDFERAFAYVARAESFAPRPREGSVVLVSYVAAVERAFAELGPGELERYRASTEAPSVELVAGELVGDRIPPGNPRGW